MNSSEKEELKRKREEIKLEYRQKRIFLVIYILLCSLFLAGCFLLISNSEYLINRFGEFGGQLRLIIVWIGILLFGIFEITLLRSLFVPPIMLKITEEGFYSKAYGFIEWTQLTDIYMKKVSSSTFIAFHVKDYNLIKSKMSLFQKILQLGNYEECSISLGATGAKIQDVYNIMESYFLKNN